MNEATDLKEIREKIEETLSLLSRAAIKLEAVENEATYEARFQATDFRTTV
jgi:hypothetical protein